jgi:hypothetical protein
MCDLGVRQLKSILDAANIDYYGCTEKSELVAKLEEFRKEEATPTSSLDGGVCLEDEELDDNRELGWFGRLFLSLWSDDDDDDGLDDGIAGCWALANACAMYDGGWSGRLDLGERLEDPRATHGGDKLSADQSDGLKNGARYNGCTATIKSPAQDRYPVFLDGGKELKIRPANLRKIAAPRSSIPFQVEGIDGSTTAITMKQGETIKALKQKISEQKGIFAAGMELWMSLEGHEESPLKNDELVDICALEEGQATVYCIVDSRPAFTLCTGKCETHADGMQLVNTRRFGQGMLTPVMCNGSTSFLFHIDESDGDIAFGVVTKRGQWSRVWREAGQFMLHPWNNAVQMDEEPVTLSHLQTSLRAPQAGDVISMVVEMCQQRGGEFDESLQNWGRTGVVPNMVRRVLKSKLGTEETPTDYHVVRFRIQNQLLVMPLELPVGSELCCSVWLASKHSKVTLRECTPHEA